jgi:hypothetical protein
VTLVAKWAHSIEYALTTEQMVGAGVPTSHIGATVIRRAHEIENACDIFQVLFVA